MEEFDQEKYDIYPIIALANTVVFPDMVMQLELSDNGDAEAARRALREEHKVFVTLRKEEGDDRVRLEDVFEVGTVAEITQILRLPNNQTRVVLRGRIRARIVQWFERPEGPSVEAESMPLDEVGMSSIEQEALFRSLHDTVQRFFLVNTKMPKEVRTNLLRIRDLKMLMHQILILMPIPVRFRQDILESENDIIQYQKISTVLAGEIEVLKIRNEIDAKVQKAIDKNQKEYVLREQIKVLRKELGDDAEDDAEKYRAQTEQLEASEDIKKAIYTEIRRFSNMGANNGEGQVIRNYIETLLSLPWDKAGEERIDLAEAHRILERDHYGLQKVKDRIMEFLAVKKKASSAETPILCLVGPPGTGKTSIAKSIAEAMNRKYVRVCLGGVSDEAEIRGHRRTYIASMPGRIIQGLRQAEVNNPLMLLDELDKIGSDYKGDPSAALLEVLDSAQNSRFIDHYIEQPVDLSHVVFIATANTTETIPRPLLDRVEVIELNSYTENEKMHIAKEHLIPKQLKNHGLTKKDITFSDAAIQDMIDCYTKEAGVRGLERVIGKVCRRVILKNEESGETAKVTVTKKNLPEFLGIYRYHKENRIRKPQVGIARGLAWTSMGGTTLEIEVNAMHGTGKVEMTGLMGEVMKESASAGLSYIRSVAGSYEVPDDWFEKHDIHIHIPEGAVPKDGPSAGITMVTAVLSAVTGIPVDSELAMTGEVTMRGRVLPIGGLKEKMLAAKKVGINKLLVPMDNKEDVADIAEEIREGMDIHYVTNMDQVLSEAFVR
ncbi:MAG: endopeptidase La [Lachnospiraceae bacterium]|nr:endopeptidase La [Lachnospiraceae bacterium]